MLDKGKFIRTLTWAWVVIIGGIIMVTPGGRLCLTCGSLLNQILGFVSIGLGTLAIANELFVKESG